LLLSVLSFFTFLLKTQTQRKTTEMLRSRGQTPGCCDVWRHDHCPYLQNYMLGMQKEEEL
jgi:hypothetical protein